MDGNREVSGKTKSCVPASICGRHGPARDCLSSGNVGGNGQVAFISSAACGSGTNEEIDMMHLSSKQISEWILSEQDPETERHLNTCGKCHEEVAGLQTGLMEFKQYRCAPGVSSPQRCGYRPVECLHKSRGGGPGCRLER